MAEKQTFKVRVRQYATGEVFSQSHHDQKTFNTTIDDVVSDIVDGTPFREFDIEVTSRPPEEVSVAACVDIPDEASVDVPDAVPA
ncbi:MAG: hypothetical protein AB7S70_02530 [Hyphomicrobium sp.]|uniref:hypothetical protein n=1 Tax=Hyphomicrobium sp. TaxID=82 RepID=UPI003D152C77